MNERDKKIIETLKSFKVLDRDQIIQFHFRDVKDNVSSCNKVLKRLQRDGFIECDTSRRPFIYFPTPVPVKKDSMKLGHYKNIADFVLEAYKLGDLKEYEVEPKVGEKGIVEPDLFMIWNNVPFFVEIQRTLYSKKVMEKKMERYKEYYESGEWKNLHWQTEKKYFPYIWIITEHTYEIDSSPLKVFQTNNVETFIKNMHKKEESS